MNVEFCRMGISHPQGYFQLGKLGAINVRLSTNQCHKL